MQKDDFMLTWPSFFAVEKASLLQKPNLFRQVVTDLEQYPRAPTSIAKRSTHQPFDLIALTRQKYFVSLVECQVSMFSSQGQVSSSRMTRFSEFEYKTISGRRDESAIWPGNT